MALYEICHSEIKFVNSKARRINRDTGISTTFYTYLHTKFNQNSLHDLEDENTDGQTNPHYTFTLCTE
jgi:hypothetical protein